MKSYDTLAQSHFRMSVKTDMSKKGKKGKEVITRYSPRAPRNSPVLTAQESNYLHNLFLGYFTDLQEIQNNFVSHVLA